MALVSDIVVQAQLKTNDLRSGITKAMGMVEQFAQNSFNSIQRAFAGVGTLIMNIFKKAFDEVGNAQDRLSSLFSRSKYLKTSIAEVQALDFAVQKIGGSIGTFDVALRTMMRNIAAAARGKGPAQDAFKELGLSAQLLSKMNTVQQLDAINNAMRRLGDQTKVSSYEYDIFREHIMSTSGVLAHDLNGTYEEFRKLGTGINDAETNIIRLNIVARQKFDSMKEGFFNKFSIPIMNMMTQSIEKIQKFIQESGGIELVAANAANGILTIFNAIEHGLGGVKNVILSVEKLLTDTLIKYNDFKFVGVALGERIAEEVRAQRRMNEEMAKGTPENEARTMIAKEATALQGLNEQELYMSALRQRSGEIQAQMTKNEESFVGTTDKALSDIRQRISDLKDPLKILSESTLSTASALSTSTEIYTQSQHKISLANEENIKALEKSQKAAIKFSENPQFGSAMDSLLSEEKKRIEKEQRTTPDYFKQMALEAYNDIKSLKPGQDTDYVQQQIERLGIAVINEQRDHPRAGGTKNLEEIVNDLQKYLNQKELANTETKVKVLFDMTDEMKKVIKINGVYTQQGMIDFLVNLKNKKPVTAEALAAAARSTSR